MDLVYKGDKLDIQLTFDFITIEQSKEILELIKSFETGEKVIKQEDQAKKEAVLQAFKSDVALDEIMECWDLPYDLLHSKQASKFITRETDLNSDSYYEKTSFLLNVVIDDGGQKTVVDRESLMKAIQKLRISDKLAKTNALLIRVKSALTEEACSEVEDYLKKHFSIDRLKVAFEERPYDDRASLEVVLFGEFSS